MSIKLSLAAFLGMVSVSANADQTYIMNLNFAGSGCNPSDSSAALYDTNSDGLPDQFVVYFSNYTAQQGPGIVMSERRKNCNIGVQMHLPQGFQFSIANVRYLGYAEMPYGVRGRQRSTYEFPFHSNAVTLQSLVYGPYSGGYERTDNLGISSVVWSPCGMDAPLNIRTQVALEGSQYPSAYMTTDQIDGRVRQIYGLSWRACY
jgi:hypothetical protein